MRAHNPRSRFPASKRCCQPAPPTLALQPWPAGSEVALQLPKEAASAFPSLLRALEAAPARALGVGSYGLSVTTLEEVFLRVSESAGVEAGDAGAAEGGTEGGSSAGNGRVGQQRSGKPAPGGHLPVSADAAAAELADAEPDDDRSEFLVVNLPHRCYHKARRRRGSAGCPCLAGSSVCDAISGSWGQPHA